MEMNDILNGLNSCDDSCSDSINNNNDCCCGGNSGGCGCNVGGPSFGGGCGINSWIWILLILFYCGCGGNGFLGGGGNNNYANNNNCCCCKPKNDCCCCNVKNDCCCCNTNTGGNSNGLLGNCSVYLFLLVILFLCNNRGGCNSRLGNIGCCDTGIDCFANSCGC